MTRDIPVGNGSLLVNFDRNYQMRDLYWPHVGQENHTNGHPFRFGVWVDGEFHWVSDEGWQRSLNYAQDTLVTSVRLQHPDLGVKLLCQDTVDFNENLYLRRVDMQNDRDHESEVRLFFNHDFHISGSEVGDSAYYEPDRHAVFHYKGKRWFMMNTAKQVSGEWVIGVDQWAVGIKETPNRKGTWKDAEDGWLSGNPVAQGSVDSTVALHLNVPSGSKLTGWYWIAVGSDFSEVTRINRAVRKRSPQEYFKRTSNYWKLWGTKEDTDFADLAPKFIDLYRRSLYILRTQIDHEGAILAANDFDITSFARDTYAYMWPRDGALVASALIKADYSELTRGFFHFCHRVITEEGFLLHKYNPDGSLASSWHGWYQDGQKVLPVQEDETALVIWALWQHYQRFRDIEFIRPLYRGLIIRAANWLESYRNENDGLPLPSWDLWEERRGVLAWTMGATWGGLQAAASFAEAFGEAELAENYRHAAGELRRGVDTHLWDSDLGCFVRMINRQEDGGWEVDKTVDASIVGLWYFGMYQSDDPKVVKSMEALRSRLWVKTEIGGIARYEGDNYQQVSQDIEKVPGNPWFISTLWLAQWHIASAKNIAELQPALDILEWAVEHALPSGVMAEQVHPITGEPLSVSPLTWSHATFLTVVQEYLSKRKEFAT